MSELLPINFDITGLDTSKLTTKEWHDEVSKMLEPFEYEVSYENMVRANSDKAYLNKIIKKISDKRKEYFKPYEDLKKSLIEEEKRIKGISDKLRDDAKALESKVVDVETKKKEVPMYTITYKMHGSEKFFDELEKLAQKHGVELELANRKNKGADKWEL